MNASVHWLAKLASIGLDISKFTGCFAIKHCFNCDLLTYIIKIKLNKIWHSVDTQLWKRGAFDAEFWVCCKQRKSSAVSQVC